MAAHGCRIRSKKPSLPGPPTFDAAQRTEVTSLYAAPLNGPSLRYLGLSQRTDAVADDGTYTRIHFASEDEWTASACFREIVRLNTPSTAGKSLDDLGKHGLHPCAHCGAPSAIKHALLHKFFANDASGQAGS